MLPFPTTFEGIATTTKGGPLPLWWPGLWCLWSIGWLMSVIPAVSMLTFITAADRHCILNSTGHWTMRHTIGCLQFSPCTTSLQRTSLLNFHFHRKAKMTLKCSAWLVAETNASYSTTGLTAHTTVHRSCMVRLAPDDAPQSRAKYG